MLTTASPRVTVAGGGSGPAGGLAGTPAPTPAGGGTGGAGGAGVPSGHVTAGTPNTIRPLRLTGGATAGKGKKDRGPQPAAAGDPEPSRPHFPS